jgi:hypothetical protein
VALVSVLAGAIALLTLASPAPAAPMRAKVERSVRSAAPDARIVKESYVRIYAPLPASTPPHPSRCDWIGYLRFRHRNGPKAAKRADLIIVMMPGFLGGASDFDQLARNTILKLARRGRHAELWALDRRANCLEDHTGVRAAARARDPRVAFDYYWRGGTAEGRRFAGFVSPTEARWLGQVGLERTLRDWYTVLRRGIPGQRRRARKVICGGHSLGGPLTAAFASWDFDGDPGTRRDAGFRQCAGLVGLDTTLSVAGGDEGPSGAFAFIDTAAAPYVSAPPFTPETIGIPSMFGVGAFFRPSGLELIRDLPHTPNIDLSQRVLFSRDAAHFATGMPSIRDFEVTNLAAFAGILDDNSAPEPLTFLRASLGSITGGPLTDKNFPAPDPTLALPEDPDGPTYRWVPYRRVGRPAPIPLNDDGEPYTHRQSEVTDIRQFARTMFEAPADFVEQYFPTRILVDVAAAEDGGFEDLRYDGPALRPAFLVQAGDSDDNGGPDVGPARAGTKPNSFRASRELILPGYNHLDVATAARVQNDGRSEEASTALARFVLRIVRTSRAGR